MFSRVMLTRSRAGVRVSLAAMAVALALGAVPALASTASEEQQGAALVKALNAGDRSCSSLSADDFERIGEYVMGLNFATVAQHDAMNRHMRATMGARGEELGHQAMGRAYAGCATAGRRGAYAPGMMGGTAYGPGMMTGNGAGAGAARLAGAQGDNGHHDWSAGAVIGIAALAAALAGGAVALFVTRRDRHRPAAGTS